MKTCKIQKLQFAANVTFDGIASFLIEPIPFIDRHHQRTSGFEHEARQMRILFRNIFLRIEHNHDDISVFHCLECFDHGEFFYRFKHFAAFAHACGIN